VIQQKQAFHHKPDAGIFGDCVRTVFACLLDLPRDQVPHFADGNPTQEERTLRERSWLAARGLREINTLYQGDLAEILQCVGQMNPGLHYMLTGISRTGCAHVVVCRDAAIVWDTSLTDAGIVGPTPDGHYWITFLGLAL
jgi:hypothetical protein